MRIILVLSLLFACALIAIRVGLSLMGLEGAVANPSLVQAQGVVDSISTSSWEFGKPLLQLIIVLTLGEWFVSRLGLNVSTLALGEMNIQTFIAVAVVFTFCLAALGNLPGLNYMKDIVLIVIGFYFGTRTRTQNDGALTPQNEITQSKD